MNKNIFIVDDHPIVQMGLSRIINEEENLSICGFAVNTREALIKISTLRPDLVIIDISLRGSNGIELIKDIKAHFPEINILVFSIHNESLYAEHALRAGAIGYLMKIEPAENIINAIKKVLEGEIYVSDKIRSKILKKLINANYNEGITPVERLSNRELEVFQLIGEGLSTRKIADGLNLGIKTIETYRFNIKKKLGLSDNTELIHYAAKWFINESSF